MSEIRPGVAPKRRSTEPYTPKKPYLKLWQSPSTFFRDAVRHLKTTVTKESAYEKPYSTPEYPVMHLNLPTPDWPRESSLTLGTISPLNLGDLPLIHIGEIVIERIKPIGDIAIVDIAGPEIIELGKIDGLGGLDGTGGVGELDFDELADLGEIGGLEGLGGLGGIGPSNPVGVLTTPGEVIGDLNCHYCILSCDDDIENDSTKCASAHAWCHVLSACDIYDMVFDYDDEDSDRTKWQVIGPYSEITADSLEGIDIYVDWNQIEAEGGWKTAEFTVYFRDGQGHVCPANCTVKCRSSVSTCNCDTVDPFLFDDDSTANTIASSSSTTIYTTGGCAPFTWSVAGTGFSLAASTTSTNTNTLISSGSACGTAVITVTDYCSTELTIYIRCTEGQWVWDHNIGMAGDTCTCAVCVDGSIVAEGQYGYIVCTAGQDSVGGWQTGACGDPCYQYSECMGSYYYSDAGSWCCAHPTLCAASVGKNCCNKYVDHPEYGTGYCAWFTGSCGTTQHYKYTTRLIRVYTWECLP